MNMSLKNKIEREHYYVAGAFGALLVLVSLYGYLLSATVVHVVMQKEMRQEIRAVHSEIAELEAAYIARQHAISNEIALLDGFEEVTEKVFIDKSAASLVLRTNN